MIRVVIVDDQPVVRAGVARILGPDDGFQVVAECGDGDEVVEAVARHDPDLVLMDVRMRRVDGVEATRRLRQASAELPVLVLTTFDDDDALWGALDGGAAGFVLKDTPAEDLIAAARAVAGGAAWLDPRVAPRVLQSSGPRSGRGRPGRHGSTSSPSASTTSSATWREVRRTARSAALLVSEATVKSHVGAIFTKLGARDRAAAIVFAYDHGIVEPGPGSEVT